jgi:hypothetical protein
MEGRGPVDTLMEDRWSLGVHTPHRSGCQKARVGKHVPQLLDVVSLAELKILLDDQSLQCLLHSLLSVL